MYCLDPVFYFVRCVGMSTYCVTKVEASKLLGVSVRMVDKYLHSGELTVDHMHLMSRDTEIREETFSQMRT